MAGWPWTEELLCLWGGCQGAGRPRRWLLLSSVCGMRAVPVEVVVRFWIMLETELSGLADGVGVAREGKRGDRKDLGLVCQSNQKNRVMARENCGSRRFEDKSQEFGLGR